MALAKNLMGFDKKKAPIPFSSSEESEYLTLKYDVDKGMNLPDHKMRRYLDLREKFKK